MTEGTHSEKYMIQAEKREPDLTARVLEELISFRDPNVRAMFEIYQDRGWLRNWFAKTERWIEVQWIDDAHMRFTILSRNPSSAIPANWEPKDKAQWLVPMNETDSLAEWINREWLRIRASPNMRLRMWND